MSRYKLVCFDVDGTLVDNVEYSWQIFHEYFNSDKEKIEQARNSFYSGKISYLEWAEHDINLWKSANATKLQFYKAMELAGIKAMLGAEEVLNQLKKKRLKLAIISGTLNVILDKVYPNHERIFDYIFLSRLYFDSKGRLARASPTAYDMDKKAEALKHIAEKENIPLSSCVFIGDHHNDVRVAEIAGLGIAFNCKSEELRKVADVIIEKKNLMEILKYVL